MSHPLDVALRPDSPDRAELSFLCVSNIRASLKKRAKQAGSIAELTDFVTFRR